MLTISTDAISACWRGSPAAIRVHTQYPARSQMPAPAARTRTFQSSPSCKNSLQLRTVAGAGFEPALLAYEASEQPDRSLPRTPARNRTQRTWFWRPRADHRHKRNLGILMRAHTERQIHAAFPSSTCKQTPRKQPLYPATDSNHWL